MMYQFAILDNALRQYDRKLLGVWKVVADHVDTGVCLRYYAILRNWIPGVTPEWKQKAEKFKDTTLVQVLNLLLSHSRQKEVREKHPFMLGEHAAIPGIVQWLSSNAALTNAVEDVCSVTMEKLAQLKKRLATEHGSIRSTLELSKKGEFEQQARDSHLVGGSTISVIAPLFMTNDTLCAVNEVNTLREDNPNDSVATRNALAPQSEAGTAMVTMEAALDLSQLERKLQKLTSKMSEIDLDQLSLSTAIVGPSITELGSGRESCNTSCR